MYDSGSVFLSSILNWTTHRTIKSDPKTELTNINTDLTPLAVGRQRFPSLFELMSHHVGRDKVINMSESKKHEDWDATFEPYHKLFLGKLVIK